MRGRRMRGIMAVPQVYFGISSKTLSGGEMKRSIAALVLTASLVMAGGALAQGKLDKVVKVGSLGDKSGLYADIGGPGSSAAAQMAIEDSGLLAKGWKIDLISADHQNKPDVGVNIGKQWIDVEKVDVFVDLASSGVGLAIANLAKEKNVVNLNSGSASSDLTGAQCSPNTVHWVYDTYMLANGTGKGAGQVRRRQLVLPDRGLRLRPRAGARHRRGGHCQWRQGARRCQASAQQCRFLLLPAAGAKLQGQDHRACQCRRRHHQRDQAGSRIRHRFRRTEARGHAAVHHRRPRARAQGRAGPELHRDVLLG